MERLKAKQELALDATIPKDQGSFSTQSNPEYSIIHPIYSCSFQDQDEETCGDQDVEVSEDTVLEGGLAHNSCEISTCQVDSNISETDSTEAQATQHHSKAANEDENESSERVCGSKAITATN